MRLTLFIKKNFFLFLLAIVSCSPTLLVEGGNKPSLVIHHTLPVSPSNPYKYVLNIATRHKSIRSSGKLLMKFTVTGQTKLKSIREMTTN